METSGKRSISRRQEHWGKPGKLEKPGKASPYLYFLPAVALAVIFSYWPFIKTLVNSFHIVNFKGELVRFVGLENYTRLAANASFLTSLKNTARFTLIFTPVNMVVCLGLAILCQRRRRGSSFNELLFFLPMAVSMSSAALIFKALFNPTIGIVNWALGTDINWFNDPAHAMTTLVVLGVWLDVGLNFILLLTALRNVPRPYLEAVAMEGSSWWRALLSIQLPLISPTLIFVFMTGVKNAMLMSGPVIIMTEGGPYRSTQTVVFQMYLEGFTSGNYTLGSTLSVVIFLFTLMVMLGILAFEKRRVYYS
ncbi:carbohydrate ABC transporter permease [Parasphaerochaeta coccoides]|uniref:Binding-protein-dependent transport systems inner membrane component n=1 Tax=Parasphaerochaeta coccoides (strain ATCC BAA-1237 / DSM 17374 / SPN1) TaxID=760011 RepID=F4GI19_PARC1|nr:sugar ABC transporter permease [Parasphaerochaeta coccoides]AEC02617.1 binding-protein-dependent transport systems inner membrane component [Parasphaerochaeta coccoides DSM 17374]